MSWFVYVVRLVAGATTRRDQIIEELERRGVPARPYFSPLHLQPFYRRRFWFGPGDFPITESISASTMALPFSGAMTEAQVVRVCGALLEVVG